MNTGKGEKVCFNAVMFNWRLNPYKLISSLLWINAVAIVYTATNFAQN